MSLDPNHLAPISFSSAARCLSELAKKGLSSRLQRLRTASDAGSKSEYTRSPIPLAIRLNMNQLENKRAALAGLASGRSDLARKSNRSSWIFNMWDEDAP